MHLSGAYSVAKRRFAARDNKPQSSAPTPSPKLQANQLVLICAALVAITAIAYWHAPECGFIKCFDDETYVTDNIHLTQGLAHGIRWAFGTEYRAANWHPLTWISLLFDYQLYGLSARGFHITNIVLHILNTLLLFLLLARVTGEHWKSGFVAALFAVHPVHVESVAWVAERKDVLSTLFWLVTLYAYVLYASKPRALTYIAVVAAFALGLLAKPMLVSLPLVMLLMDFWPLRRMAESTQPGRLAASRLFALLLEKAPLLIMAAASCVITVVAQRAGGAVAGLQEVPLSARIGNAAVSYLAYIGKMIWPMKLAAFYPHPRMEQSTGLAVGAIAVLILLTVLALRAARRRPYLAMGWLWYLITLVPVIGLVQVGSQGMADRYTYITLVGLFIAVAWGLPELLTPLALSRSQTVSKGLAAAAVAVLIALTVTTQAQVEYWRDPITLFRHAAKVTKDNSLAYERIGRALEDDGSLRESLEYYNKAVEYGPSNGDALMALGRVLIKTAKNGPSVDIAQVNEGMSHLELALKLGLNTAEEHQNLAFGYYTLGELDRATQECLTAQRLDPRYAPSEYTLGNVIFERAKTAGPGAQRLLDKAMSHWRTSVEYDPLFYEPHFNLAYGYYLKKDYAAAWRELHLYEKGGRQANPKLRELLSQQTPEPR